MPLLERRRNFAAAIRAPPAPPEHVAHDEEPEREEEQWKQKAEPEPPGPRPDVDVGRAWRRCQRLRALRHALGDTHVERDHADAERDGGGNQAEQKTAVGT